MSSNSSQMCFLLKKRNAIKRGNQGNFKTLKQKRKLSLPSLPPSSVEAEKCFSVVGLYITKLRSSHRNEIIDNYIFFLTTRRLT